MASTVTKPTSAVCQEPDKKALLRQQRIAWLSEFFWLDELPGEGGILAPHQAKILWWAVHRMKAAGLFPAVAAPNHVAADIRALVPAAREAAITLAIQERARGGA